MTDEERKYCLHLLSHFSIDGTPADKAASAGQIDIFYEIVFRRHKRLQILCSTQYGKSLFVALACIIVACVQNEKIAILAPTDEKAKIIMRYFVEHLADHEMFYSPLEKKSRLDRLRMEDTKDRIIMRKGGGIFMISVQAGNSKKGIEAAMGEGAKNVIMDEACLIPDQIEATVFRMIAGKGPDAFYCKIGNPFYRNHFLKSDEDENYHRIFIDYKQGLREGRYTYDFIEESRRKPYFDVLYECKFPTADLMDASGYLALVPEDRILMVPKVSQSVFMGRRILGIDPAGEGKDKATFMIRDRFTEECVYEMKTSNPRQIAERALMLIDEFKINYEYDCIIDGFGVGTTVGQEIAIASEGEIKAYTVLVGNKPEDEEKYNGNLFKRNQDEVKMARSGNTEVQVDIFLNLRALLHFRQRAWLLSGGAIVDNSTFKNELTSIKYKRSLQGNVIQLMPKKEMLKLGIPSPNCADAGAITFIRDITEKKQSNEEVKRIEFEMNENFDPYSVL